MRFAAEVERPDPGHDVDMLSGGARTTNEVGHANVIDSAGLTEARHIHHRRSSGCARWAKSGGRAQHPNQPRTSRHTAVAHPRRWKYSSALSAVEHFVREYLGGAIAKDLAAKHGFGLTATKQLLKRHGARKR